MGNIEVHLVLTLIVLLLFIPIPAMAYGKIYSMVISPEDPVAMSEMKINIGVLNDGKTSEAYKLKVYVLKDGKIKYETNFLFDLKPGSGAFLSPTYVPDDISEYKILVELYDPHEINLYDTTSEKVNVKSEIGPFDLVLDVLPKTVRPGDEVPLKLMMINMGEKGTDVKVRLELDCIDKPDIYKEFFIYLGSKTLENKLFSIQTCDETGIHDITSKLILWNTTWVSSINQILINETYIRLKLKQPELIEVRQGESKIINVFVENTANTNVNNLRMVIEKIPLDWNVARPELIVNIKPGETVVFMLNITVPEDLEANEYPIKIVVAGDETMAKADSVLKVAGMAAALTTAPTVTFIPSEAGVLGSLIQLINIHKIEILTVLIGAVAAVIIKGRIEESKARFRKERIMRYIKDTVTEG